MYKTGFATIIGKPNVGKSTLTNRLVGEKVSIVSFRPQTTRDRILGIDNGDNYQLIIVDTPGIHSPKNKLSEYMMKNVSSSVEGVDVLVYMISCDKKLEDDEIKMIQRYAKLGTPLIVAINKCDESNPTVVAQKLNALKDIKDIVSMIPISAKQGKNVDLLRQEIIKYLPVAEKRYDDDMFTDKPTKYIVGEYIREKALKLLGDEVPYGIGVIVNKFSYRDNGIVDIDADIICEKQAHKAIIIGKNGEMIKKISSQARIDMENLLGNKVFLTVYVKVKDNWRDNPSLLNNLGYNSKEI